MRECEPAVRGSGRSTEHDPLVIEARIRAAVSAVASGDHGRLLVELVALTPPDLPQFAALVDDRLRRLHDSAISELWERGWQPADVQRVVARNAGPRHGLAAARAVLTEAEQYPSATVDRRWLGQLRDLELLLASEPRREELTRLGVLDREIAVLAAFLRLPRLPRLCPLPGQAHPERAGEAHRSGGGSDPRMLVRVRGLLAKAESTSFEEEAEALSAKAQELMSRHSIDVALVESGSSHGPSAPSGIRIGLESPYASAKATLIGAVAAANKCRTVRCEDLGFVTVFGYEPDLEATELLYTSLLVQATTAMGPAERRAGSAAQSRKRAFRHSFLVGYASRIGERLREAARGAAEEAIVEHGGSLLPVLASRKAAVDDATRQAFPELRIHRTTISHGSGYYAGRVAADDASLSTSARLGRTREKSA